MAHSDRGALEMPRESELLSWALTAQGPGPAGDTGQVHSSASVSRFATSRLDQLWSSPLRAQSLIYVEGGRGRSGNGSHHRLRSS